MMLGGNDKRYPQYRDSGVEWLGKIPAHWDVRRLKSFARVSLSNVDKKSVEGQASVRLCNYVAVYSAESIDANSDFMPATATAEQIQRFSLRSGDVLMTKDSETWLDIAVPALVSKNLPGVLCGYHLAHVRPHEDCDGAYLSRCLSAVGPRDQYQVAANGITRFGLTGSAIGNSALPLPPIAEQRAIATFLNRETVRIDTLIERKERLVDLLQERRTALISHVVTRGLASHVGTKNSSVDWFPDVPAHWQTKRLKFVAPFAQGKSTSALVDQVFIGLENIESRTGRLLLGTSASKVESSVNWFAAGDVLFGKLRPYLAKVGRPTMSGVSTTEIVALQPVGCSQAYLFYALLNDSFIRWVDSLTFGSKMPRVSPEQIANAFIAVPPEAEQRAIADFLDHETAKIDALVAKVREAIEHLKEYRLALISAAVTGKIDVREESAR